MLSRSVQCWIAGIALSKAIATANQKRNAHGETVYSRPVSTGLRAHSLGCTQDTSCPSPDRCTDPGYPSHQPPRNTCWAAVRRRWRSCAAPLPLPPIPPSSRTRSTRPACGSCTPPQSCPRVCAPPSRASDGLHTRSSSCMGRWGYSVRQGRRRPWQCLLAVLIAGVQCPEPRSQRAGLPVPATPTDALLCGPVHPEGVGETRVRNRGRCRLCIAVVARQRQAEGFMTFGVCLVWGVFPGRSIKVYPSHFIRETFCLSS